MRKKKRPMANNYRYKKKRKKIPLLVFILTSAFFVALMTSFLASDKEPSGSLLSTSEKEQEEIHETGGETFLTAAEAEPKIEISITAPHVREEEVQKGQTAAQILSEFLTPRQIHDLGIQSQGVYPLSRMRAGQPYRMTILSNELEQFEYEISNEKKLIIKRDFEGFSVYKEDIKYDIEVEVVHGKIDSSLFLAVSKAGEKPALAIRLADIFAWDIDFIRDIRQGDSFIAVVEKKYRSGEFTGYGRITAARFINKNVVFNGFLFDDGSGGSYYDASGRSLRKAFLKVPLKFSRISSGFNLRRLHPILKIRRAHPGIDYAAPSGTPVKAIGDGTVIAKGWDRGGGNYVKIRHNSVYESTYMHLKGFARGLKKGKRVQQGQTIAYVGSTGLSTGPHLDFRMKKNGKYINPQSIKSPPSEPVKKEHMPDFESMVISLMAQLNSPENFHAQAETTDGKPSVVAN